MEVGLSNQHARGAAFYLQAGGILYHGQWGIAAVAKMRLFARSSMPFSLANHGTRVAWGTVFWVAVQIAVFAVVECRNNPL